jgi:hypothetical protein
MKPLAFKPAAISDELAAKEGAGRALSLGGAARACKIAAAAAGLTPGALPYGEHIRWAVWFVAGCSGLIGATLLVLWAASGFADLGVSGHGLVALILGVVVTTALGIGLMALSFYSDRSGTDRHGTDRHD